MTDTPQKLRTQQQNKALHKYFTMVAHELRNQGQTMQDVVNKINLAEIYPSTKTVKELIWRPIQEAQLGKLSSRDLTTDEIDKVYEPMAQFMAKNFGIDIPFPSIESSPSYLRSLELHK